MARDNFPKPVIDKLRLRVAARCSNPSCRRPTTAAGSGADDVNNAGIAAHIHAAAPGGPRYSPTMTPKQRRAIENGIWLCGLCSIMVDRDEEAFTPALLRSWKAEAEARSRAEQGRPLPSAEDAVQQVSMALTGLPQRFIPGAITNVHQATAAALEALDPRFHVRSEFKNGRASFSLAARETVNFGVQLKGQAAKDFPDKFRSLVENGEAAHIPSCDLQFTGSELLARLSADSGEGSSLVITPPSKPAIVKLTVPRPAPDPAACDELAGHLFAGSSMLRFEGAGYGGILRLEIRIARTFGDGTDADLSLRPDFGKWDGRDVLSLPYFDKVMALGQALDNGGRDLGLEMEVDGNSVLRARNIRLNDEELSVIWNNHVAYVERARSLAKHLDLTLHVNHEAGYSAEEHMALATAVDTLEGRRCYRRSDVKSPPEGNLKVLPEARQEIEDSLAKGTLSDMTLIEQEHRVIQVFGTPVTLPRLHVTVTKARPRVVERLSLADGDEMRVRWELTDESVCSFSYAYSTKHPGSIAAPPVPIPQT